MAMADVGGSRHFFGELTAQVNWLGLRVGGTINNVMVTVFIIIIRY